MMRILFLLKADQLGLFDTATMQAGYVNQHGTFVAPAATHRKKRAEKPKATGDLFGVQEVAAPKARDYLGEYIAKKGGEKRIASMLDSLNGEQRARILEEMAKVGKTTAAAVNARLAVTAPAPVADDLFAPANAPKPAKPKRPAAEFKYFADFAKERTGGIPSVGTAAHAELKAEWDAKAAAPSAEDVTKLREVRDTLKDMIETKRERGETIPQAWTDKIAEADKVLGPDAKPEKPAEEPAPDTSGWSEAKKRANDLYLEYKRRAVELMVDKKARAAFVAKVRAAARKTPIDDDHAVTRLDGLAVKLEIGNLETRKGELKYAEASPKEGDTKTEDGIEYQLKGGRWHKITPEIAEDVQKQPSKDDVSLLFRVSELAEKTPTKEAFRKYVHAYFTAESVDDAQREVLFDALGLKKGVKQAEFESALDDYWSAKKDERKTRRRKHSTAVAEAKTRQTVAEALQVAAGSRAEIVNSAESENGAPDYSAPFVSTNIPQFGVDAGVTKNERKRLNKAARDILHGKETGFTDAEKATLSKYSGNGGVGDSLNEFYTRPDIAGAAWKILNSYGVDRGEVLEPSCGPGVFAATAPAGAKVVGVELDPTSARIAGILHERHEINQSSMEGFAVQDVRRFAGVVGNAPFGPRGALLAQDKPDLPTAEQYFLDTSIDKTVPGGIVALIVPTGIMDNANTRSFRENLLKKAEFIGAHRMPNTAFEHAHTGVTTDLVLFRRRPDEIAGALSVLGKAELEALGLWDSAFVSGAWFESHPERIYGKQEAGWRAKAGMGNDITVEGAMNGVADAIAKDRPGEDKPVAVSMQDILALANGDEAKQRKILRGSVKQAYEHAEVGDTKTIGGIQYVLTGQPPRWHRVDGAEVPEAVEDAEDLAGQLDELFERGHDAADPAHIAEIQAALSAYVKKHGIPSANKELKEAAGQDKRLWRLIGAVNKDGSFSSLVTGKEADNAGTFEGIAGRLSREMGSFTVDDLAREWGHERDDVLDQLFASPHYAVTLGGNEWVAMDDYLTGNLWLRYDEAKLSAANEGLSQHYRDRYAAQVAALEAAIDPKPLDDAFIELNSAWIPTAMIGAWSRAKVAEWEAANPGASWHPEPITVSFDKGIYKVGGTFGYAKLIETYLNRTGVRKDDMGTVAELNQEFRDWLLSSEYREEMEDLYNRKFRGFKEKDYANTAIDVPGLNPDYALNDYHWGSLKQALDMGKGIIAADVGLGKAQPLDAKILTPTGWKLMGDIQVGDAVIAGDGTPTIVTGVFPQGEKEIFRVTFSDGAQTECCEEHLWQTQTQNDKNNARRGCGDFGVPKVRSLSDIMATLRYRGSKNHAIPMPGAVQFVGSEVPLHPYLLGALIGDGCLSGSTPMITNPEQSILNAVAALIPVGMIATDVQPEGKCRSIRLRREIIDGTTRNEIGSELGDMGLKVNSQDKFVPDAYKFNDAKARLAMLHGLMDTDGYISKDGCTIQYTSTSRRLAEDVVFLVQSFGGNAWITSKIPTFTHKGEKKQGLLAHTVGMRLPAGIVPFLHSKKLERYRVNEKYLPIRYFDTVVSVGMKPAQCISVDHPSQLYLTDDFIVTHNTPRGLVLAKLLKTSGQAKKPMIVAPKSVLVNWVAEINNFFPGSKIMVIGENMEKGRADNEIERNAKYHELSQNNDYDFVLISQPAFNDLDLNPIKKGEYQEQDFWTQRGDSLGQAGDKKRNDIRERYQQALAGRDFRKRADSIWFDELGVDALIVDEAHAYKNLYAAKARFGDSPKFLGGQGLSKRALDLNVKAKWIRENNGGKNIYGLTATPTANSPLEIYSMLSHICPDEFESRGIMHAEHFLDRYARFEQDLILNTNGGIEEATVTAGFQNLSELRELMRKYIWRQTAEQVGLKLPQRQDRQHLVDMTAQQQAVYSELRALAEDKSKSDTSEAHIFSIMINMQKAGVDLELYDPVKYAGAVSPKYDAAAKEIVNGLKDGGQVVFMDYNDGHEKMAQRLVAAGIPRDQIGIINADEAESGTKRQKISDDFNKGKLRVVIGNTATMGEGINLQKGTTDIHHLDLTWNPAGMQQRNGRGLRQGNKMEAVRIHSYLARGSFDGYRHQTIASKKNWQDALWSGGDTVDNFAREGKISDQDMKVMLAADPDEARAIMDANKALHDEIASEAGRARSGEVFVKFQDMKRTLGAMKDKTGATARKLADRIEKARTQLKHDKYFDGKEALDAEGDALVQPKSGAVFVVGKAFEMQPGPSAPINYSNAPSKWVVTGIDSRSGTVRARLYGGDSVYSMDIAKMSEVKPVKHDAAAENSERARAAVRDNVLKAIKSLNAGFMTVGTQEALANGAAKAMISVESSHGADWHKTEPGKTAMNNALHAALTHESLPEPTTKGFAQGLLDRAIMAKYDINPDELKEVKQLRDIPPELVEREMPMLQALLKRKAGKHAFNGSSNDSYGGTIALKNNETGRLEVVANHSIGRMMETHSFPFPTPENRQKSIDAWVDAQMTRKIDTKYQEQRGRKSSYGSYNKPKIGIKATYGNSITTENTWTGMGTDLFGEEFHTAAQAALQKQVRHRILSSGDFTEALSAAMASGKIAYDGRIHFDHDALDALWLQADTLGVLNKPINEAVKLNTYNHGNGFVHEGVLYQADKYGGDRAHYMDQNTKVVDALNLFAKTAKYNGLPKTMDQIMNEAA